MSVNEKMKKIADAIRERTGKTDSLTLDGMAEGVCEVYDAGYAVYWNDFWDLYQEQGLQINYKRAFYNWTLEKFKPKYDIKPTGEASWMFGYFNFGKKTECDIAKRLEDCGVIMDTSGITAFGEWMNYTDITRMPEISTIGASGLSIMFYNNQRLHTIDKLILKEDGSQSFSTNTFYSNWRLENLIIEGKIGSNANFQWCPLTKASLTSVINALLDTAAGKTLTLKLTAVQKAFETSVGANDGNDSEEWKNLVASKKNWTITLV